MASNSNMNTVSIFNEHSMGTFEHLQYKINDLIQQLLVPETREEAYILLNIEHSKFPNLSPLIWKNDFVQLIILQDIISIYPALTSGTLTTAQAHRLSNTLTLVQRISQHPLTKNKIIASQIPIHIYPLLQTMYPSYEYEFLRLSSISIIATLVRTGDPSIVTFLIVTGFIPIALIYMEYGTDSCRIYSIFILRKILNDNACLKRICGTSFLLNNFLIVLHKMIIHLTKRPVTQILRHVVKTYLRLADHSEARRELSYVLPEQLRDQTFAECFKEDFVIETSLKKLIYILWLKPNA